MSADTSIYHQIYAKVAEIPLGFVSSYGGVAKAIGLANGARVVGWALRDLDEGQDVPWQRVVNKDGFLTIVNPKVSAGMQKQLLEKEGNEVVYTKNLYKVVNPKWHIYET